MPLDIKVLVTKILWVFSHIHDLYRMSKYSRDFARQEYKQILCYPNVRGLSLLSALERVLKIYLSLKFSFSFNVRTTVPKGIGTVL